MTDNALMNYWKNQAFVSYELEARAPSQAVRPEKKPRVRKPCIPRPRRERPHPSLRRDTPKKPRVEKVVIDDWVPTEMSWD